MPDHCGLKTWQLTSPKYQFDIFPYFCYTDTVEFNRIIYSNSLLFFITLSFAYDHLIKLHGRSKASFSQKVLYSQAFCPLGRNRTYDHLLKSFVRTLFCKVCLINKDKTEMDNQKQGIKNDQLFSGKAIKKMFDCYVQKWTFKFYQNSFVSIRFQLKDIRKRR